jgi:hypothetical protein
MRALYYYITFKILYRLIFDEGMKEIQTYFVRKRVDISPQIDQAVGTSNYYKDSKCVHYSSEIN